MSTAIETLRAKKWPSASDYRQGKGQGVLGGQGTSRTQGGHEGPSSSKGDRQKSFVIPGQEQSPGRSGERAGIRNKDCLRLENKVWLGKKSSQRAISKTGAGVGRKP